MSVVAQKLREQAIMSNQSLSYRLFSADDIARTPQASLLSDPLVSRFAAKLAESMGQVLSEIGGGMWRVTLDRIDQDTGGLWEEAGLWFRLESHQGSMRMHTALDRAALSAVCDAALGGSASEPPYEFPDRPLSNIEKGLLRHVLARLELATTRVLGDQLATPVRPFESSGDDEPADKTDFVTFRFLANSKGYSGEIRLTALKHEISTQFSSAAVENSDDAGKSGGRSDLQRRISSADISFGVTLGPEMMVVDDIATLVPGKVLRLTSTASTPVILQCLGSPVFTAMLLRTGDRLSVRIMASVE